MSNTAQIRIQLSNGQEAGKTINELTAQSAKFAREIKKMEVGSAEFVTASEDFKKVSGRLKDVKKEAFDTAQAQEFLNSTFKDMIPFQAELGKLSAGMKGVGVAVKATTGFMNLLKLAIASTGIGLLVIALGSLVAWLRKTQAGMDFVGKVTAAAGAAFQVIIDRALSFASAMSNLVQGNFGAALDDLKGTFAGLGKEIKEETAAAYEMEGAMQDITRAEKQLELQRSRSRAEIEKLKMAAEDQTKSENERLAAAQKAFDLENALLNQSISLQQEKLNLINAQNAQGTSTDEDLNRAFDVEIELNNMREESFTKQTELQNKINELKRSGATVTAEIAKEEFYVVSENLDKELAALEGQIGKEHEAIRKGDEEKKKLRQEAIDGRMEQLDQEFELQQLKLEEQFFTGQITEQELRESKFAQEKAFLEQRLAELALLGSTEVGQYQQIYTDLARLNYEHEADKTKVTEENEKKRKELQQQGLAAAAGVFAGLATLLSQNAKDRKKNFGVLKAVQAAEIAANTTTEISNIFKGFSSLGPLGQVLAVVQAALAAARGASAVSRLNSVQIQGGESFADGGPVFGPSHQAGGIKFSVGGQVNEMEGNEIILSKGVYQNPVLRGLASDLNVMGGGRSFALGGPVLQDRGFTNTGGSRDLSTASAQVGGSGAADDLRMMEEILLRIESNTRVSAEKPVLAVTQIREKLQQLQDTESDATF